MGEVLEFTNSKAIAAAILDEHVTEVRRAMMEFAEEHLRRVAPHLYEREDIDPEIVEALFAAGLFQACTVHLSNDARTCCTSEAEFTRYNDMLNEIL